MTLKTDVLYLQKDRFEIYSSTSTRAFEFLFVPEIVQDYDVKNAELFENLINVFISSNKIPPSELIIVLSDNACFVKDFAQPVQGQQTIVSEDLQKQVDQFIQHVPFDKVASVTFPLPNGIKVCATNEGLYQNIISPLEKLGFKINSVIPGIAYGNNLSGKTTIDKVIADFILQSADSVKQNSFLIKKTSKIQSQTNTEEMKEAPEIIDDKPDIKNNKRIFILVGVFILLLIVLVIVYVLSTRQSTPKTIGRILPSSVPVTSPQVAASSSAELVVATPNQQEIGNLTLSIINASGSTTQGEFLREQLSKYGFKTISLQNESSIGTSSSVITFSSSTGKAVINLVLDEVKKITKNFQVQVKSVTTVDIEILIGK